jgi:hypothetical protein
MLRPKGFGVNLKSLQQNTKISTEILERQLGMSSPLSALASANQFKFRRSNIAIDFQIQLELKI